MVLPDSFCPYVGLRPFEARDRDYFFGREREIGTVVNHLFGARVTVLYGASGVGKSSVLMAGVMPALAREPHVAAVVFRDWSKPDAVGELKRAVAAACDATAGRALGLDLSLPLDELLAQGSAAIDGTVLLILDQFEEYFLYFPSADAGIDDEMARAMLRRDVDAGFLIALREDALSKLDRLKKRVPTLLTQTVRLGHLGNVAARRAIRGPLEHYVAQGAAPGAPRSMEDELVDEVVRQTSPGRLSLGSRSGPASEVDEDHVEAPYLQLVLERLWAEERQAGSGALRLATLERLQGAEVIVREHLRRVIDALPAPDQELCALLIDRLVTPSGAKIAVRIRDLASYAGPLAPALPTLVAALEKHLVLSRIRAPAGQPPDNDQLQIVHDVMGAGALAWRAAYLERAARAAARAEAQRMLDRQRWRQWALIAAVVASLAVGGTMFMLYQRAERAYQRADVAHQQAEDALKALEAERVKSDQALIALRAQLAASYPDPPPTLRSPVTTPLPPRPPAPAVVVGAPRIYVHHVGPDQRAVAERLRAALQAQQIDAPAVQQVERAPDRTEVRYFHDDAAVAAAASDAVARLQAWNFGPLPAKLVPGPAARVPKWQLEVWLADTSRIVLPADVERIDAPDKETRLRALAALERNASAMPRAIGAALDLFATQRIDRLSPEGRFNALHYLARSAPLAWDGQLYARGRELLARLEQRTRSGIAIGDTTRAEMRRLAAVLDAVRDGKPGPAAGAAS